MKTKFILFLLMAPVMLSACQRQPELPEGLVLPTEPPNIEEMQPGSSPTTNSDLNDGSETE